MISKRNRRSTQPQENLKQFSLNNSKGIDESKPITDNDTVQYMENLKVNSDGSLSLRERMRTYRVFRTDSGNFIKKVFPISSDTYIVLRYDKDIGYTIGVCKANDNFLEHDIDKSCTYANLIIRYTTFQGSVASIERGSHASFLKDSFNLDDAVFIKTPTTVTLGNCTVNPIYLRHLVDSSVCDEYQPIPRYLQVYQDTSKANTYVIEVKNPEMNVLNSSESGLTLPINTTLDNPYAIADTYDSGICNIKGILLYIYTDRDLNIVEPPNSTYTVKQLTQSTYMDRYRPVVTLGIPTDAFIGGKNLSICLKAFGDFPSTRHNLDEPVYAVWKRRRPDGTYEPVPIPETIPSIVVREPVTNIKSNNISSEEGKEEDLKNSIEYETVNYGQLPLRYSDTDNVNTRMDVLKFDYTSYPTAAYEFKIISKKQLDPTDPAYDKTLGGDQYGIGLTLDIAEYVPKNSQVWEFADYDDVNSVFGKKLLYRNSIYSYGGDKNTIFKSDAGSLYTPYLNSIDSSSIGTSMVTCVVPWRDYLYIATEASASLATPSDNGFYIRTVNTHVGIPEEDSECCKNTLNGIIFKSGSKVFLGYPNLYAENDVVLNYTEISKPIESFLETVEYTSCYAVSDTSQYNLILLNTSDSDNPYTYILKYTYVDKIWSVYKYPRALKDAYLHNDGTLHAFYNTTVTAFGIPAVIPAVKHALLVEVSLSGVGDGDEQLGIFNNRYIIGVNPIPFKWDTGQKTDSISNTKQFVESKIMFATLDERDKFPFTTHIAIDGTPHIVTTDVSTDAPFWKTAESFGVAGTSFSFGGVETPASGAFNTLRQLVLRYSGKGKSIRHVIEGQSIHDFKMYETYVRYKNLNGK